MVQRSFIVSDCLESLNRKVNDENNRILKMRCEDCQVPIL